jgi:hypothetical protein
MLPDSLPYLRYPLRCISKVGKHKAQSLAHLVQSQNGRLHRGRPSNKNPCFICTYIAHSLIFLPEPQRRSVGGDQPTTVLLFILSLFLFSLRRWPTYLETCRVLLHWVTLPAMPVAPFPALTAGRWVIVVELAMEVNSRNQERKSKGNLRDHSRRGLLLLS